MRVVCVSKAYNRNNTKHRHKTNDPNEHIHCCCCFGIQNEYTTTMEKPVEKAKDEEDVEEDEDEEKTHNKKGVFQLFG